MKNFLSIITIIFLGLLVSCEGTIFIPIQGKIRGAVFDNNGQPLTGIQVSATFDAPENSGGVPIPNTVIAITNSEGVYLLDEVWDRVDLTIQQPGFKPVFESVELVQNKRQIQIDFALVGSPTVLSITPSKLVLAASFPDSIKFAIKVEDIFNTSLSPYLGHVLLKNNLGHTEVTLTAAPVSQSLTQLLFDAVLPSGLVISGTYKVVVEITDPDGNFHQLEAPQRIIVE